ncbi:ester cyclase [Nisaea sp.]|uniref:ester cyclase n=1 Tax=Nisaea sp. TaxID=2024842 RepID=UPI003299F722
MTNKEIVQRFNHVCLAGGDQGVFEELFHPEFVNHTTIPGMGSGIDSMRNAIFNLLHVGLSEIRVEIDDQLEEGDKVATRKRILACHTGTLAGVPATGREIEISVYDIVRLKDGKYIEHWGLNTLPLVLQSLKSG